jgi:2'-5' RNA ligase
MSDTVRAFLALAPPHEWREYFAATQNCLREFFVAQAPQALRSIKWVTSENIHLTLLFLGEIAVENIPELAALLESAVSRTPAFDLSVSGFGCFPPHGAPRVLWLGVNAPIALRELQAKLVRELAPRRAVLCPAAGARAFQAAGFSPHLTLARLKNLDPKSARALRAMLDTFPIPSFSSWHVTEVQLLRSDLTSRGAKYSLLATARLVESSANL